ncbi:MAG: ATP-binding protein [Roseiflexaceae bacterium]
MELRDLPIFQGLPDEELAWVAANSREIAVAEGEVVQREGQPAAYFYVVVEGELQITRTIDGKTIVVGTTPRGVIGGEQPLLSGAASPTNACAIMPTRLRVFDQRTFRAIFGACPSFGARILQVAAERVRLFSGMLKQQEKMAALGKLSAGLSHELNNPAAAARRAADMLSAALPKLVDLTIDLCGLELRREQFDALVAFERMASARPEPQLAPLERSDREDELGGWLDQHGAADAWDLAPSFVAAGISSDELAPLIDQLPGGSAGDALAWMHTALMTTGFLHEIAHGTTRISELVGAVKAYTYMDQAALQEIDLRQGLDNTLTVLHHKLRDVTVLREYDPLLPGIMARGGELNQVWTNLLDNAIDAMGGHGTIRVITRHENNFAMVEIADDGPGIPPEVQGRIFEPFFTTKDVGIGTGLGLDISLRIIQQHNGTIEVQSRPGQTRFIIRLPIHQSTGEGVSG